MRVFIVVAVPAGVERLREVDTYIRSLPVTDEILLVTRNEFLTVFCDNHKYRVFTDEDLLKQNTAAVESSDLVVAFTDYLQSDSQLVVHSVTMARLCGRPTILNPHKNGGIKRGRIKELLAANK